MGADDAGYGYAVAKRTHDLLGQLEGNVIHISAVDAGVELLGIVRYYDGSRKKSNGDETYVGLTGITVGTRARIKIGVQVRVELAIAEDKPALVNGRGTVFAVVVAEDVVHRARLVRKAKHGQLELSGVVRHADSVGERTNECFEGCVCLFRNTQPVLVARVGWSVGWIQDREKAQQKTQETTDEVHDI